jgi:hypothetical protein
MQVCYRASVVSLKNNMPNKYNTLLIRLRPGTRELLDKAADDQRRSRASIIDEAINIVLRAKYSSTSERLNAMLGGGR